MMSVNLKFALALCEQGKLVDLAQGLLENADLRFDVWRTLLRDMMRDLSAMGVLLRQEEGMAQIDLASLEMFFMGVKNLRPDELYEGYTLTQLAAIWRAQAPKTVDMARLADMIKQQETEAPCARQPDVTAAM